ncbi:MAG: FAD-dependent oxidoreductase [Actinomycetota bacterium]|nr:FAD-dependent oxidoreductase [Actinomycetota bacterium]
MARTPLANAVEEAVARIAEDEARTTRRGLLQAAGAAVGGATMLGKLAGPAWARSTKSLAAPRIVVVGAGLAGLTAAYRLKQAGYAAEVYEASGRVGGRCWTGRGDFVDGQIYEHGGELIDSGHINIKQLAHELGLSLDNLYTSETKGTEQLGYFFGKPYTFAQMTDDLKTIWQQVHSDVSAASYPTLYSSYTARGQELDRMTLYQWIESYVPGGHGSPLGRMLDVAYNIEYGAETTVQSSLNMLYLLGYVGPGQFRTFGKSNEKFHVHDGNDQIPQILAQRLSSQITPNAPLTAIKRSSDGTYTLTFANGSGSFTRVADHVVLALPFSILRDLNFSKAGFNAVKTIAINELGMGTNAKVHVQFNSRFWRDLGCTGETYSDTGYQNTWESSRAQPGQSGMLVWYTGGNPGVAVGSGTPEFQVQTNFLPQLKLVLPGADTQERQWNGRVIRDWWTGYPWTKGSYSYWKAGQYTRFSGAEKERSNNCHFCGEHTSQDFQGYLQGGVETGERAASEILADLK